MVRWVAILLLLTTACFGQSPKQIAGSETPKSEQTPKNDKRGTPDKPLTVNVIPTAEQKAEGDKKYIEAASKAADDKKLVEYTGDQVLIAIVTFFIFVFQLIAFSLQAAYMRRSVTEMRKTTHTTIRATRAATKASDSAFAAERARLFIVIDETNLKWMTDVVDTQTQPPMTEQGPVPADVYIRYHFKNYGKTPGIITELAISDMISTDPFDPVFTLTVEEFPERMIGADSSTIQKTYSLPNRPAVSQARAIQRNAARLWFAGRLYYDDVFGNHQIHRFYFRTVRSAERNCFLQSFNYKHNNHSS